MPFRLEVLPVDFAKIEDEESDQSYNEVDPECEYDHGNRDALHPELEPNEDGKKVPFKE